LSKQNITFLLAQESNQRKAPCEFLSLSLFAHALSFRLVLAKHLARSQTGERQNLKYSLTTPRAKTQRDYMMAGTYIQVIGLFTNIFHSWKNNTRGYSRL